MAVTLSGERTQLYSGDIRLPEPAATPCRRPRRSSLPQDGSGLNLEEMVGRVEQLLIQEALRQCGGNKAKAASSLGHPAHHAGL